MEIKEAFGKILRRTRRWKDISQEALSLEADVSRTYVSKLENGVYQPSLSVLFAIAEVLEMKPSELVALIEEELKK
ncbi:MAG: helix-turn-helix transcriptional regulator [Woeseiaceae bacterium]